MKAFQLKQEIIKRKSEDVDTIDVICELVEASDDFDYHDVADLVKADPTMLDVVTHEFQKRNMLPKTDCEISLVDLFENM